MAVSDRLIDAPEDMPGPGAMQSEIRDARRESPIAHSLNPSVFRGMVLVFRGAGPIHLGNVCASEAYGSCWRVHGYEEKVTHSRFRILAAVPVCLALSSACSEEPAPAAAAPPEVYVTDVVARDVPTYLELVGQTVGYQDVDIRARVEGFLETMDFREGSFVQKGALLYQIDRKPLEATLAAARAEQATAEALLD